MKQIIILNGPPRCGKDTLAKYLVEHHKHFYHVKFSDELKRWTHRFYGTANQNPDAYEKFKDTPLTEFLNLTPRQAYINVSEEYIKRFHGQDFFGLQMIFNIKRHPQHDDNVFVISDGGFAEELQPLLKNFNPALFTVLHIYREGCSFNNDSRHYLSAERFGSLGVKFKALENNGSVEDYLSEASKTLSSLCPDLFDTMPTYNAKMD